MIEYRQISHSDGSASYILHGCRDPSKVSHFLKAFGAGAACAPQWLWDRWFVPSIPLNSNTWIHIDGHNSIEFHLDMRPDVPVRVFTAPHIFQCPKCHTFVPIAHSELECQEFQVMEIHDQ